MKPKQKTEFDPRTDHPKLKFAGYEVSGYSRLALWGGGEGEVEMKPMMFQKMTQQNMLSCINDNRFGCECIMSADISVSAIYTPEYGHGVGKVRVRLAYFNLRHKIFRKFYGRSPKHIPPKTV